jgi:hypothetical protein
MLFPRSAPYFEGEVYPLRAFHEID